VVLWRFGLERRLYGTIFFYRLGLDGDLDPPSFIISALGGVFGALPILGMGRAGKGENTWMGWT